MKEFDLKEARNPRPRRYFLDLDLSQLRDHLEYAKQKLGFNYLSAITGTDEGENLGALYHLTTDDGVVLTIKTLVPKSDPVLKTVTDLFPRRKTMSGRSLTCSVLT